VNAKAVIALDLGGTKLACAVVTPAGKLLSKSVLPLAPRTGPAVAQLIREQIERNLSAARVLRFKVTAISICVPGVSHSDGSVWAPNISGWSNYQLGRELRSAFTKSPLKLRIHIASDRECYILGESWRGAAKHARNAIYLAVGTGIGAGIMSDGRVLRGAHDIAGAVGWMALQRPFRPEFTQCGCFEHYASGAGIAKHARELKPSTSKSNRNKSSAITAGQVLEAYARKDAVATKVLRNAIEAWGMGVANLVSIFNPEKIIFGGGVFGPAVQFLPQIRREAEKWAQPLAMKHVKLLPSRLGPDAAIYGAAFIALDRPR
jgi:glucokinase